MGEKGPELSVVSHRFSKARWNFDKGAAPWQSSELSCHPPGHMRSLSLGSPGSPTWHVPCYCCSPGTRAVTLQRGSHFRSCSCQPKLGTPPGTQAETMSPSSPQEEAEPPVPKPLSVVHSQRGGVSDPSDDPSSSCAR